MTRYDPFSYGQVPLNTKEQATAPDDLLFAEAAPVKQVPAAESDWGPPEQPAETFKATGGATQDALAFGADILGEQAPEAAKPTPPAPRVAKPAATRPAPGAPVRPGSPVVTRPSPLQAPPAPTSEPTPDAATNAPVKRGVSRSMARRRPMANIMMPLAVVGVGGAAASWFALMQQNPIMAAIIGVTSILGAALARVMSRG